MKLTGTLGRQGWLSPVWVPGLSAGLAVEVHVLVPISFHDSLGRLYTLGKEEQGKITSKKRIHLLSRYCYYFLITYHVPGNTAKYSAQYSNAMKMSLLSLHCIIKSCRDWLRKWNILPKVWNTKGQGEDEKPRVLSDVTLCASIYHTVWQTTLLLVKLHWEGKWRLRVLGVSFHLLIRCSACLKQIQMLRITSV